MASTRYRAERGNWPDEVWWQAERQFRRLGWQKQTAPSLQDEAILRTRETDTAALLRAMFDAWPPKGTSWAGRL